MTTADASGATIPYYTPTYYRHSGRAPIAGVITTLGAAGVLGMILGVIYAYMDVYIPIIGVVSILMLVGLVVAVGWLLVSLSRWAQIRNTLVVSIIAVIVALLTLYMSWVGYEHALAIRAGESIPFFGLLIRPDAVVRIAAWLNETGVWGIGSSSEPIKGIALLLVWLVEAGIILVGIPRVAIRGIRRLAFCEGCHRWCTHSEGVARLEMTVSDDELRRRIESGDLASISQFAPAMGNTPQHVRLDLLQCDQCDSAHMLSVNVVELRRDRKGNLSTQVRPLVDRLLITSAWAEWIRAVTQPPPVPAAEAAPQAQPQIDEQSPQPE